MPHSQQKHSNGKTSQAEEQGDLTPISNVVGLINISLVHTSEFTILSLVFDKGSLKT